jgi:peptidoglycan/LPS O-acetylase OafA/YrhL
LEKEIEKFDYIDALRGLAILMVFCTHLRQHISVGFLSPLFIYGQHGVQLFFLVSAFTLCLSISTRDTLAKENGVYNYRIRRFFRIAPLYYLAIGFYALKILVHSIDSFPNPLPWKAILLNMTFLHGFSRTAISSIPPGGWSIAAEMMFYLLLPLFLKNTKTFKQSAFLFTKVFAFSVLCKILGRLYITYLSRSGPESLLAEEGWFFYFWLPWQLPVFTLGILGYFAVKDRVIPQAIIKFFPLVSLLIFYLAHLVHTYLNQDLYYPTHLIFAFSFLFLLLFLREYPTKILVNKVFVEIGKVSFGIYLFHFFMLDLFDSLKVESFIGVWGYTLLCFLATFGFSYLTYIFVEQKGITLGQRFLRRN